MLCEMIDHSSKNERDRWMWCPGYDRTGLSVPSASGGNAGDVQESQEGPRYYQRHWQCTEVFVFRDCSCSFVRGSLHYDAPLPKGTAFFQFSLSHRIVPLIMWPLHPPFWIISISGDPCTNMHVHRDYLTDLFPILELGTSAKVKKWHLKSSDNIFQDAFHCSSSGWRKASGNWSGWFGSKACWTIPKGRSLEVGQISRCK